jgi:hypothetical protein
MIGVEFIDADIFEPAREILTTLPAVVATLTPSPEGATKIVSGDVAVAVTVMGAADTSMVSGDVAVTTMSLMGNFGE